LDDGRLDLLIEPRPRVVEPPLDGVVPVAAVRTDRLSAAANLEWNVVARQVRVELGLVRIPTCAAPSGAHKVQGVRRTCPWYHSRPMAMTSGGCVKWCLSVCRFFRISSSSMM